MRSIACVLLAGTALGACGGDADGGPAGITVFAAASLTDSFAALGAAFEEDHPGTSVTFNFGSSADLVAQINEGAPADVFAGADQRTMAALVAAGNHGSEPAVFATNSLAIIVEQGNPEGIEQLADLEEPNLTVVMCDPNVPIGGYAAAVLAAAGVTVEADSYEEDVKAVVTKVVLGEADAGLVYSTDVLAAADAADGVEIPAAVNARAEYPIAVTAGAPNAAGGRAFVDLVVGERGREILLHHGFSAP